MAPWTRADGLARQTYELWCSLLSPCRWCLRCPGTAAASLPLRAIIFWLPCSRAPCLPLCLFWRKPTGSSTHGPLLVTGFQLAPRIPTCGRLPLLAANMAIGLGVWRWLWMSLSARWWRWRRICVPLRRSYVHAGDPCVWLWACIFLRTRAAMHLGGMGSYWSPWRRWCTACSCSIPFLPRMSSCLGIGMPTPRIGLVERFVPLRMATVVGQLGNAGILWFVTLAVALWRRLRVEPHLTVPAPSLAGWCLMVAVSLMGRVYRRVPMVTCCRWWTMLLCRGLLVGT